MKKLVYSLLTVSLLLIMINKVSAQVVLPEVTITATHNIPDKVDKAFKSTFSNAADPVWYQANKNYLVKFIDNDMKNNALFRKNGEMIYKISYGYDKDIPVDVSKMIKDKYDGYNVVVAFNVKQEQRDIWIVNLENDKNIVTARVEDGVLDEAKRLKKKE